VDVEKVPRFFGKDGAAGGPLDDERIVPPQEKPFEVR
jgi:hypothetical protein